MAHLAMGKKVAWSTVIYVILLIGVCVAAHFYPWLQPVCTAMTGILTLVVLATGLTFGIRTTAGGGGAGNS